MEANTARSEDESTLAKVIVFPGAKMEIGEETEIEDDASSVAFILSSWAHPSTPREQTAHCIAERRLHKSEPDDPWNQRLTELINNSPLEDDYDDLIGDEVLSVLEEFLIQTKKESRSLATERKAALTLMKLRAYGAKKRLSDASLDVFKKILRGTSDDAD